MNKILFFLVSFCLVFSSAFSSAATRHIPKTAKTATLISTGYPFVRLDDKQYRLAPGARIFSPNNTTILPANAPQQVAVKYLLDAQGMVNTIWILMPQEQE